MKLYFAPGACSLSPHIVLREAEIPFELHAVDLATKTTRSGDDFADINPKGQVPALLLDDASLLTEVPAIVQFLGDRRPDAGLVPAAGTLDRYRLQEWLSFVSSELHKGFSPLFRPDTPQDAKRIVKDTIATRFNYLDRHLANNSYLLNGHFGVGDSYAFAIVNWSRLFDIELSPWPNLAGYMDRIAARPRVQEAMRAEGLI